MFIQKMRKKRSPGHSHHKRKGAQEKNFNDAKIIHICAPPLYPPKFFFKNFGG